MIQKKMVKLGVFGTAVTASLGVVLLACGHNADKAKQVDLKSGERFYQKGEYGDAEIQFRKAIQEDPRFGEAYLWLGRTARQRGNYGVARDGFQQAAALMTGQDAPTKIGRASCRERV